jgi:ATP-dependent Clp protease protease subunit
MVRLLPLRGPITRRTVFYFMSRLLYLAAENPEAPILMEVTSPGGLIPQSLEIMRLMDKLPCAVNTFSRGVVGGTATVIAAHGARGFRTALPTCRFSLMFGATRDVEAPELDRSEPPRRKMVDCLLQDGARDRERILNWLATGAEFDAQEAVQAGLLDFVSR